MTDEQAPVDASRAATFVDYFLKPELNDAGAHPILCAELRSAALRDGLAPIVLPRWNQEAGRFRMYVIARSTRQTTLVGDLLGAFVGPSFASRGDTMPATLNQDDPLDQAVIERFGATSTYIVSVDGPNQNRTRLRTALELMVRTVNASPHREWTAPRPLGRLLADFEAALLAGAPEISAAVLERITLHGGLSATNLVHLQLKRHAVLGQADQALATPGLDLALLQDPPRQVKELVLAAVHAFLIGPALDNGDADAACQALRDPRVPNALPVDESPTDHGDAAAAVLLVALLARGRVDELAKQIDALEAAGRRGAVPPPLRTYRREPTPTLQPTPATVEETPAVGVEPWTSWSAIFAAIAQDDAAAIAHTQTLGTKDFDPDLPASPTEDQDIAAVLAGLSDEEHDRLWRYALTPFLQEVTRCGQYFPLTLAQITASSVGQRRDPANLAVVDLLLELFLRTAPVPQEYANFLEHLRYRHEEWVAPETAEQALDYVDRLLAFAVPDRSALLNCALDLLTPLERRASRLEPVLRATGRALSADLGVSLLWPDPPADLVEESTPSVPPATVLIYGLDEGVLTRVQDRVHDEHPQVRVLTNADKVGSASLRDKVRNADRVVVITQCATHAATGFISQHAQQGSIIYPPGAGSVSVYRALVHALSGQE